MPFSNSHRMTDQIREEILASSKQTPDLMPASRSGTGDGKRILANLEHGTAAARSGRDLPGRDRAHRQRKWELDGWAAGLGGLVLLLALCGWLAHENIITPMPHKRDDGGAQGTTPSSSRSSQSAEARSAAPGQAARIVNDTAAYPVQAAQPAVLNPIPLFGAASEAPAQQSMLQTSAARLEHKTESRTEDKTEKNKAENKFENKAPYKSGYQASYRRPELAKAPQLLAAPDLPAGAAKTSPVLPDTDVTLLAALVAHANKPAVVTPERSRDIVDRQPGDSTDTLLARCKQLGQIEGMLCRSRICSGRWESDAACRAPGR